jgi:hypothetical protein
LGEDNQSSHAAIPGFPAFARKYMLFVKGDSMLISEGVGVAALKKFQRDFMDFIFHCI